MKKFTVTLFATMMALSMTGCGANWEQVITKSGFTDVVKFDTAFPMSYYVGTAGACQIRFVVDEEERRLYATVPGSESVAESEFVGDPSLELLKLDWRFAHCFADLPTESE